MLAPTWSAIWCPQPQTRTLPPRTKPRPPLFSHFRMRSLARARSTRTRTVTSTPQCARCGRLARCCIWSSVPVSLLIYVRRCCSRMTCRACVCSRACGPLWPRSCSRYCAGAKRSPRPQMRLEVLYTYTFKLLRVIIGTRDFSALWKVTIFSSKILCNIILYTYPTIRAVYKYNYN